MLSFLRLVLPLAALTASACTRDFSVEAPPSTGQGGEGQAGGAGGQGGQGGALAAGGAGGADCDPTLCAAPAEPDCGVASCVDGECGSIPFPFGVALPSSKQVEGDCSTRVCDGRGGVTLIDEGAGAPCDDGALGVLCAVVGATMACVACAPSSVESCDGGLGDCAEGSRICDSGGAWGPCAPAAPPTAEVCGGGDESCDGVVDEGCSWSLGARGTSDDSMTAVAVGPLGEVFTTGGFSSTALDLGVDHLPPLAMSSVVPITTQGGSDAFVAKYDPFGVAVWAKPLGGPSVLQRGQALAIDQSGRVWVAGRFQGTLSESPPGALSALSQGGTDLFVAALDGQDGALQAVTGYGSVVDDEAAAIAVDGSDNVFVTGVVRGDVVSPSLTHKGAGDVFLLRIDGNGGLDTAALYGDDKAQEGTALAIDSQGNVLLAVGMAGFVNFGAGNQSGGFAGFRDVGIVKLKNDLSYDAQASWFSVFGEPSTCPPNCAVSNTCVPCLAADQLPRAIAVDAADDVYFAGEMAGDLQLGSLRLTGSDPAPPTTTSPHDVVVAKLDGATGAVLWAKRYGDPGDQLARGLSVSGGRLTVAGHFQGTIDFGGQTLVSAGDYDVFVAVLDAATGAHIWSRSFGGAGADLGSALAVSGTGYGLIAGLYTTAIDFGQGALNNAGKTDGFVASFLAP